MNEKKSILPFLNFDRSQSLSGILLLAMTLLALVMANTPVKGFYEALKQGTIGIGIHSFILSKPLILWINDGLMAVFFFMIGLEIKRELLIGELKSPGKAALPLFAAVGGMIVPVLLFLLINRNPGASHGWGIPMATDIAFSLAILKLLGKRVPVGLKVFLTAFAIIDDIGAVLVIALFYSETVDWMKIVYALIPLSLLAFLNFRGYFSKYLHFIAGVVVWYLFLRSGIHPTIAGILLAFTVPVRQKTDVSTFAARVGEIADNMKQSWNGKQSLLSTEQISQLDELENWTEKLQSPLQHLEHSLQSWVAYLIMPLFAFFNAGIAFTGGGSTDFSLAGALSLSLFLGKSAGLLIFSLAAVRSGLAKLPDNVTIRHIIGVSFLAGVGFTMSIFIANLAFGSASGLLDSSKTGILAGSFVSGIAGYLILNSTGRKRDDDEPQDELNG